jgi:undecaprenyl diphosphate synthase
MGISALIAKDNLPKHVAIIMDGNGRWAKEKGKFRVFGHQNGVLAVRDTVEGAVELGIQYLTLYAFSTENWNRPQLEVNALMELLVSTITKETKTLMENEVRLNAIGDLDSLPKNCHQELKEAMAKTSQNKRCTLTLALSYSSRWELTQAAKHIAELVKAGKLDPQDIDENLISKQLNTADLPDPELMIRTSGELRISNFLLWQLAYAELYFTPKLWPDFRREDLFEAILDYQKRERRFGMTSEQLK